jgi:hypothetical protein
MSYIRGSKNDPEAYLSFEPARHIDIYGNPLREKKKSKDESSGLAKHKPERRKK